MSDLARHAALGALVTALAIAALAQRRDPHAALPLERAPRVQSSTAARAIRDGTTIDLNSAGTADLVLLPGVGPKLAERILSERDARKGFRVKADLLDVRGIGATKYARIERFVRVDGPAQSGSSQVSATVTEK